MLETPHPRRAKTTKILKWFLLIMIQKKTWNLEMGSLKQRLLYSVYKNYKLLLFFQEWEGSSHLYSRFVKGEKGVKRFKLYVWNKPKKKAWKKSNVMFLWEGSNTLYFSIIVYVDCHSISIILYLSLPLSPSLLKELINWKLFRHFPFTFPEKYSFRLLRLGQVLCFYLVLFGPFFKV